MDLTKTYFDSGDLMDPEGWPAAFEPKIYGRGCHKPVRSKERTERILDYRKLVEQVKPIPDHYLNGRRNNE